MRSARGVADDAILAQTGSGAGSIAAEFRRERVDFERAKKGDRIGGWSKMRAMLADACRYAVVGANPPRRVGRVTSQGDDLRAVSPSGEFTRHDAKVT